MRYAAFISYSHKDRRSAQWLHRKIEGYRLPKAVRTDDAIESTSLLRPVFLDRAELPSTSDLDGTVKQALADSNALIVVCSLASAQSRWVNEEIRAFKALGRASRIFCLVINGDPASGNCFAPALRFEVEDGEVTQRPAREPLAADIRAGNDDRSSALLKIIAGLLGLPLDRLKQREAVRHQRRLALIASAATIGCVSFATLSVLALRARADAERQRINAEQQSMTARRTADFMKSLFAVSDPSESRGNSITAREVLDNGVRQIDSQLKDAPLVRGELTTTLGEVYASLGLYNDSLKLLDRAASIPNRPADQTLQTKIALAELHTQRADYPAAIAALDTAATIMKSQPAVDSQMKLRLLGTYGDVFNFQDDAVRARGYFTQALAIASQPSAGSAAMRARFLEGIAQSDLVENRFDAAEQGFQQALREQIAATGELHPRVSEIINELGSVEYLRGRRAAAIPYYRRCLAIDRQVFGPRHPSTGPSINNLARMLLEVRQFDEADKLLEESIDIRKGQVLDTDDAMAFAFSNLALARMHLNDLPAAEVFFHKALDAAIANQHRLHGPILVDLADLECRTGRFDRGLLRLDEARPIIAARYPDDPWRTAHLDMVRAACLTGVKRYDEASALIAASLPIELKKWPAATMYGHDSLQRAITLYARSGREDRAAVYRTQLARP